MTTKERQEQNRNDYPTLAIIDSQSVKNTDCAEQKGYDAGKKISGIKRHIAVDVLGLPHTIYITTANINDRQGAIEMFQSHQDDYQFYNKDNLENNLQNVQNVLADGGYTGENFANSITEILNCKTEV